VVSNLKKPKLNKYTEIIVQLKSNITLDLFKIGAVLKEVRDKQYYKERHDDFEIYLGEPEISFSRATAFKAIKIYEVFTDNPSALDIGTEKLYLISRAVEMEADTGKREELIEMARTLSTSDLKDRLRELQGKPPKHTLSLPEKVKAYIDQIQIDELLPDKRKEDWEYKFAEALIMDWESWER